MTVIVTRLTVAPDGVISSTTPLPAGNHQAEIEVTEHRERRGVRDMIRRDLPWDGSVSLRREDMYDENGRPQ